MDSENPIPVQLKPAQLGLREATLLALAASYAALMFDMQEAAVIGGWIAVALVGFALVRGPRPSGQLLFVYGLGLFLMLFWWPREHWWQGAIPLLWIGIGLMAAGGVMALMARRSRT
jgi:hypothetical protein